MKGTDRPDLKSGLLAGGAARMWERIVRESLDEIGSAVPPASRVLEVGYGDGQLSCWLADELGWRILGLDVRSEACEAARANANRYGVQAQLEFRVCRPEDTRQHRGTYDAVFIKTVLYSSASLPEYREWLNWILSILRPGGILVNFESGRANRIVQMYRRIRGRSYTDLCLYTSEVERLYDERFTVLCRRYYGGLSQFLAPVPGVYEAAARVEATIARRSADNCFAVSMVARKPA